MRIKHGTTTYVYPSTPESRWAARREYRSQRKSELKYPRFAPIGGRPQQREMARDRAAHMLLALLVDFGQVPGGVHIPRREVAA